MHFRQWFEDNGQNYFARGVSDVPFQVGGKNYILRFSTMPTSRMFPHSPYGGGIIAEIVWFPAENDELPNDLRYGRTGGNSLSTVRGILTILPTLIKNWVVKNKPMGFYWKGDDARLASVWKRVAQGQDFAALGYVPSRRNPRVLVQANYRDLLDEIDF